MKKIFISLFLSSLLFTNAYAVTLYQALNETYKNNTQLNAERENIKAAEEDINISQADYLPSVSLNGSKVLKIQMRSQHKVELMQVLAM